MSSVKYSVLQYTRTAGASDEDAARARSLLTMRPSSYIKRDREGRTAKGDIIETLQDLAALYDDPAEQQRFTPPAKEKNLRNREFLSAMILDGEGRADAVPPIWRTPIVLPVGRKRGSACVALPAPSVDGSAQPEVTAANFHLRFELSSHSVSRYVTLCGMAACITKSLTPCFICSLPRQKQYNNQGADTSFEFDPLKPFRYTMRYVSLPAQSCSITICQPCLCLPAAFLKSFREEPS